MKRVNLVIVQVHGFVQIDAGQKREDPGLNGGDQNLKRRDGDAREQRRDRKTRQARRPRSASSR